MVLKDLKILMLLIRVASALEGLRHVLKNIFKEMCYLKHKLEFLQNIVQLYALFIISYFLSVKYLSIDHSDSIF